MPVNFATFDPRQGLLLDKEATSLCRMEVRENADLRWMVSEDGVLHGAMSLKEPGRPVVPYLKSLLIAQILKPDATKVLNLGLGTGSIERYLGEVHTQIKLTTVEISQARLEQTKQFFHLPSGSSIVIDDATKFICREMSEQDIIYFDLFDIRSNYNTIFSNDFVIKLWGKLSGNGILAINYVLEDQNKLIDALVILRKIFAATAIINIEDHNNIVVFAFKTEKPDHKFIESYFDKFDDIYDLDFAKILASIEWLPHHPTTT
tara:strand:- start:35 stop:820 length:786 start_codon:yes stop_codon:yes gene_type:complete